MNSDADTPDRTSSPRVVVDDRTLRASFARTFASEPLESSRRLGIGVRPVIVLTVLAALVGIGFLVPTLTRSGSGAGQAQALARSEPSAARATGTGNAAAEPTGQAPAAPGRDVVDVPSGKCMTATGDGMPVVLQTCSGSPEQRWSINDDGTVESATLCLDLPWGATTDGTHLQVAYCTRTGGQQFSFTSSQQIVSQLAMKCLQVAGDDPRDNANIVILPCADVAQQKWQAK